jgi:hypothetical protein
MGHKLAAGFEANLPRDSSCAARILPLRTCQRDLFANPAWFGSQDKSPVPHSFVRRPRTRSRDELLSDKPISVKLSGVPPPMTLFPLDGRHPSPEVAGGDEGRHLFCQMAIEIPLWDLIQAAVKAGWDMPDVLTALTEVADNLMLAWVECGARCTAEGDRAEHRLTREKRRAHRSGPSRGTCLE